MVVTGSSVWYDTVDHSRGDVMVEMEFVESVAVAIRWQWSASDSQKSQFDTTHHRTLQLEDVTVRSVTLEGS